MNNFNLENRKDIKTQVDAVIYYIKNLDIDMIDLLLEEKYTYQDFKKNIFIQKLSVAFNEFLDAGETLLETKNGFCSEIICNNQCSGLRFSGLKSSLYFDLIIDTEKDIITDIYECSSFICLSSDKRVQKRVLIDRTKYIFNLDYPKKDF